MHFVSNLIIGYSKKNRKKNIRENAFEQKKNKSGLKFSPPASPNHSVIEQLSPELNIVGRGKREDKERIDKLVEKV